MKCKFFLALVLILIISFCTISYANLVEILFESPEELPNFYISEMEENTKLEGIKLNGFFEKYQQYFTIADDGQIYLKTTLSKEALESLEKLIGYSKIQNEVHRYTVISNIWKEDIQDRYYYSAYHIQRENELTFYECSDSIFDKFALHSKKLFINPIIDAIGEGYEQRNKARQILIEYLIDKKCDTYNEALELLRKNQPLLYEKLGTNDSSDTINFSQDIGISWMTFLSELTRAKNYSALQEVIEEHILSKEIDNIVTAFIENNNEEYVKIIQNIVDSDLAQNLYEQYEERQCLYEIKYKENWSPDDIENLVNIELDKSIRRKVFFEGVKAGLLKPIHFRGDLFFSAQSKRQAWQVYKEAFNPEESILPWNWSTETIDNTVQTLGMALLPVGASIAATSVSRQLFSSILKNYIKKKATRDFLIKRASLAVGALTFSVANSAMYTPIVGKAAWNHFIETSIFMYLIGESIALTALSTEFLARPFSKIIPNNIITNTVKHTANLSIESAVVLALSEIPIWSQNDHNSTYLKKYTQILLFLLEIKIFALSLDPYIKGLISEPIKEPGQKRRTFIEEEDLPRLDSDEQPTRRFEDKIPHCPLLSELPSYVVRKGSFSDTNPTIKGTEKVVSGVDKIFGRQDLDPRQLVLQQTHNKSPLPLERALRLRQELIDNGLDARFQREIVGRGIVQGEETVSLIVKRNKYHAQTSGRTIMIDFNGTPEARVIQEETTEIIRILKENKITLIHYEIEITEDGHVKIADPEQVIIGTEPTEIDLEPLELLIEMVSVE
ncbi:MAG: hypothetical protein ABIA04_06250 [Pseudomonadota bacterium]